MDLGGQAASRPAECVIVRLCDDPAGWLLLGMPIPAGAGRVLVSPADRGVDIRLPRDQPAGIGPGLQPAQYCCPDTGALPATEQPVDRLPRPVLTRQVPPWGTSPYPPADPIDQPPERAVADKSQHGRRAALPAAAHRRAVVAPRALSHHRQHRSADRLPEDVNRGAHLVRTAPLLMPFRVAAEKAPGHQRVSHIRHGLRGRIHAVQGGERAARDRCSPPGAEQVWDQPVPSLQVSRRPPGPAQQDVSHASTRYMSSPYARPVRSTRTMPGGMPRSVRPAPLSRRPSASPS